MQVSCLFILAKSDLILILIAPKLFTSSIFINVYIFPKLFNISSTWSVVTASTPQPNEFNWTSSIFSCLPTKSAAAYSLAWYVHWSTTLSGLFGWTSPATLSSVNTQSPRLVIILSIPWFISGSTWYGLPASTIPFKLLSPIYFNASFPFSKISFLHLWYSFSASSAASVSSLLLNLYSLNSGSSKIVFTSFLVSNGKKLFINLISFNSSTLFFKTSGYEITIGQL